MLTAFRFDRSRTSGEAPIGTEVIGGWRRGGAGRAVVVRRVVNANKTNSDDIYVFIYIHIYLYRELRPCEPKVEYYYSRWRNEITCFAVGRRVGLVPRDRFVRCRCRPTDRE